MESSRGNRRKFFAGMIASIGSVLFAKTAFAFPPGTRGLVNAATRLLQKFGVSVAAMSDTRLERDVLTFEINPLDEIQYVQNVLAAGRGTSCWITLSFRSFVEFTNFNPPGVPEIKVQSEGGVSVIEILNPEANVQIVVGDNTYDLRDGVLIMV